MTDSNDRVGPLGRPSLISRRAILRAGGIGTAAIAGGSSLLNWARPAGAATNLAGAGEEIARTAKELAKGRNITLRILEPSGSLGNIKPVADLWTAATGIKVSYIEVPNGEISQKVLLEAVSKAGSFDIALPAGFSIPDLAASGILVNLDKLAQKHEPAGFRQSILYSASQFYKGNFYGYNTDGDTYLTFYRKDWIEDPKFAKPYSDKFGVPLAVPDSWSELDRQLAFFHQPDKGQYGGALFRSQYFIAWEWWVRFHAKGFFPFTDDLTPQINNEAGIQALAELVAASKSLYPGARTNGLFENFEAYGKGDIYANIGWGGTQKYLDSKSSIKGKTTYGPTPGGSVNGKLLKTPYFNWGWNYVVSTLSPEQEIAYLLTLYATSPELSTIAVRDPDGYFDPFRLEHYTDPEIISLYTPKFLAIHEASMKDSIPDLYMKGQGEYFDALRVNIQAADVGEKTPKAALDQTAREWQRISRRIGRKEQTVQWLFLKSLYPEGIRAQLS
jgi:multiple sugar transport system substrate-binding protein